MTIFLSHLHTALRATRFTRRGATRRPEDVPQGTHKEYSRMERISLPEPVVLDISLPEALSRRVSSLNQGGDTPLSLQDIGTVFGLALRQHADSNHRNYPSGGALYPIETYLIATSLEGAAPGVYHYHPSAHALEYLWELEPNFDITRLVQKPEFLLPSALIVFTSVWRRSSAKYGDFTYGLSLLEAGHMSENVLLVSSALKLQVRPMAGFDDQRTNDLLDLDPDLEQAVHSITLSKGAHVQTRARMDADE